MKTWKSLLLILMLLVGCRQQAQPTVEASLQIDLRTEPEAPAVGEAILIVTVRDASGQPVNDAVIEMTLTRLADTWETPEAAEGIAAFLEKRKANWVPADTMK